ncbi:MAG: cytochrome c biogenesis heme-transporting ATPase CcmA [Gallionella sp.]|nr:cytochrome c biogenesis heme-transporting ATPase CcmA [Gallionella sp.]
MLEGKDVACIRGGRTLFSHLDFTLRNGELLQVQGANGAGKTSLLRMLCGLTSTAEGEIRWGGASIDDLGEAYRADLLYLGHHNAIQESLTARENLQATAALAGVAIDDDEAGSALRRIGLRGREDLPARFLSQGQKRRVALARLMWSEAPLWVLDEPFVALDAAALALLAGTIAGHLEHGGMAVLTSHQDVVIAGMPAKTLNLSA